jgi:Na+/proline symporter
MIDLNEPPDHRMSVENRVSPWIIRCLLLLVCGGLASSSVVVISLFDHGEFLTQWRGLLGFFGIGVLVTFVLGLPLLFVADRWFRFRGRYVVAGALYGLIFWLIVDAPIFPKDWPEWFDQEFLLHYAMPRGITHVIFGAVFGLVFTLMVWGVGRKDRKQSV